MTDTVTVLLDPTTEALASHPPPLANVGPEFLDRLAALALRVAQVDAAKRSIQVPATYARSYLEFSPSERAAQRATVLRVLQAAVLLGLIELPS